MEGKQFEVLFLLSGSHSENIASEPLGSKEKFWFILNEKSFPEYLFKYPREDTGEHWAEKVASEIAKKLQIPSAEVNFASFKGTLGVMVTSIMLFRKIDERVCKTSELIHGNDILAGYSLSYDREKIWGQKDHSWKNIKSALKGLFPNEDDFLKQMKAFAGIILLDAIICNTDRHHENWALLKDIETQNLIVSPTYDHASSLGRELTDEKRKTLLVGGIEKYIEKAHGGIFWDMNHKKGENPIKLLENIFMESPEYFKDWTQLLQKTENSDILSIIDFVPSHIMSDDAKSFSKKMLELTLSKIRGILR